ncbi:MAG: hypothetical protein V7K26_15970 [Nostoc sp.]|uniref:hypothetical protein n=1 Tax=Nostoc sp. TaxID=1180 RepID=UPI002FEEF9A6
MQASFSETIPVNTVRLTKLSVEASRGRREAGEEKLLNKNSLSSPASPAYPNRIAIPVVNRFLDGSKAARMRIKQAWIVPPTLTIKVSFLAHQIHLIVEFEFISNLLVNNCYIATKRQCWQGGHE